MQSGSQAMNVLVVDRYPLFREGLKTRLNASYPPTLSIIESASLADARHALSVAPYRFDLVLLDLQLDDTRGIDSLICIKRFTGRTPILVLSADDDRSTAKLCMDNGAVGFLSKCTSVQTILLAIQQVLAGETLCPAQFSEDDLSTPSLTAAGQA